MHRVRVKGFYDGYALIINGLTFEFSSTLILVNFSLNFSSSFSANCINRKRINYNINVGVDYKCEFFFI